MVDANQDMEAQKELNQPETQKVSKENSENVQDNQSVKQEDSGNTETEVVDKSEKMVPQSEVDKLVWAKKNEAREAYERGQREALIDKNLAASVDQNDPNKVLIDREELSKIVSQESARLAEQQRAQEVVNQFVSKVQAGSKKHPDYEDTVAKLNLPYLPPQIVEITNAMDNTADILYELGKNPSKFSSVLNLCNTSPQLAYDELNRLSNSIKKNEQAAQQNAQTKVNEPLDQVKPSNTGTDNGELKTVTDWRKHPSLRG